MMVRWDVPSWDGFSYNAKITKYVIWVWMMAAGRIEVDKEAVRWIVSPPDLGYEGDEHFEES